MKIIIAKPIESNRRLKDILFGSHSPLYWREIISVSEEIKKNFGISFLEHVLKCFFVISENKSLCVHYQTKSSSEELKKKHRPFVEKNKPYKGPPSGDTLLRTCGIVSGCNNGYLWLKDKSHIVPVKFCTNGHEHHGKNDNVGDICRREQGCSALIVEDKDYALKCLIVENVRNITLPDNTQIDFSPYLRSAKNINIDKETKKLVDSIRGKQRNENMTQISKSEKIHKILDSLDESKMTCLSSLSKNDKKKIRDYWDYYNKDYADALVKDI